VAAQATVQHAYQKHCPENTYAIMFSLQQGGALTIQVVDKRHRPQKVHNGQASPRQHCFCCWSREHGHWEPLSSSYARFELLHGAPLPWTVAAAASCCSDSWLLTLESVAY